MAVEFLVDPYNIDSDSFDLVIQHDLASVREARLRINENLASGSIRNLRIRIVHESLLRRFSDYLGINGVKVTFTPSPRARITEAIKSTLPDWVSEDVIIQSDCLRSLRDIENLSIEDVYRSILGFTSDAVTLSEFMTLYYGKFELYSESLSERTCFNFVYESLKNEVQPDDFRALVNNVLEQTEGKRYIEKLAYASQIEKLRQYTESEGLTVALPPMPVTSEVIRRVYFCLDSKASPSLENALTKLFDQAIILAQKANDNSILERFPLIPVEAFFGGFVERILCNYTSSMEGFVTNSLPLIPQIYHDELNKLLLNHSVDSLSLDADIGSTLTWADNYFKVLRASWVEGASIPQGLETCFSDWYLKNGVRVSRSKNNWTGVSASIQQSFKDREVVVVYMVDALSGIHLNEVSTSLAEKLPQCHLSSCLCFAPTPTLTEVGKTAVLTGKKPYSLSKDNEKAVLDVYEAQGLTEHAFTVHKSWEHRKAARLNENTQLYLYLENRIDDCLHERKQYEDYNAYGRVVDFVVSNIAKHAQEAFVDAKRWSKKIKFIVTADHGLTKSSGQFKYEAQNVKERVVLNVDDVNVPETLYKFDTGYRNLGTCLIPKNRDSFQEVAFSHGGLTPEEVLIPWIELTSNDPHEQPFILTSDEVSCHSIGEKRWNITLSAIKNASEEHVTFKMEAPFSIIGNGNWDSANEQLHLSLHSSVNHEGLVEVAFTVGFKGKHVTTVTLEIDFPKSFVKQDKASSAFDDMLGF
ncbi:hypothetical protein [Vibrio sp. PID17_43]|uniref:hypothetical protein n=1 Tax=Vibrio sp. PID17_43 TaxID=1583451 RepID=UPI000BFFC123|nr:hypothetical protein [Vibrio sp. PID17_43]PHJ42779.1 hypothetical protein AK965_05215 [Vibrio sp. PID17_43]